jgi:hypothetical protein
MMKFRLVRGIPYVTATIEANGQNLKLENVLLDTGSGECVFKTELLEEIGVQAKPSDKLITLVGIGGEEVVVQTQVDALSVGTLRVSPFTIQLGAMEYGFEMDGIIGADFLLKTGAKIDFAKLEIGE